MARDKVFISYSHADKSWLDRLKTMLQPLVRGGAIELWDDTTIRAGANWREEIEHGLAAARVAVLLVSAEFLASEFIAEKELPPLLQAAEKEGITILWVYLSPCLYEETPIEAYQAAHDVRHSLVELQRPQQELALRQIGQRIRQAFAMMPASETALQAPRGVDDAGPSAPTTTQSQAQDQVQSEPIERVPAPAMPAPSPIATLDDFKAVLKHRGFQPDADNESLYRHPQRQGLRLRIRRWLVRLEERAAKKWRLIRAYRNPNELAKSLEHLAETGPFGPTRALSVLRSYRSSAGLDIAPDIPQQKEQNGRRTCRVPKNEDTLALIDCTVWGSAKDCWIFSSRGLYSHMGTVHRKISYQDLASQPGKFQIVGPEIRLGDGLQLSLFCSSFPTANAVALLEDLRALVRLADHPVAGDD